MALTQEQIYASKIFLNAALPLAKVIAMDRPKLNKPFLNKTLTIQFIAKDPDGDVGTHFIIENGEWTIGKGIAETNDICLTFKSIPAFNDFFAGRSMALPKIKGFKKLGSLIAILKVLLKMASLLQAKDAPKDEDDKVLLVKLYFYLLANGISQLNKAGHEEIHAWAMKSPDRVYAFSLRGHDDVAAYIRVKAGNSRAGRGLYQRSKPFFTLAFRDADSALGILLQKDDMIESAASGKMIMEGAPEFGGQLGEFMMIIAGLAK